MRTTPPVFVDPTGRRRRFAGRAAIGFAVPAVAYACLLVSTTLGGPTLDTPFVPVPDAVRPESRQHEIDRRTVPDGPTGTVGPGSTIATPTATPGDSPSPTTPATVPTTVPPTAPTTGPPTAPTTAPTTAPPTVIPTPTPVSPTTLPTQAPITPGQTSTPGSKPGRTNSPTQRPTHTPRGPGAN